MHSVCVCVASKVANVISVPYFRHLPFTVLLAPSRLAGVSRRVHPSRYGAKRRAHISRIAGEMLCF